MADQAQLPLEDDNRSAVLEQFGKDFSGGLKQGVSRETKPEADPANDKGGKQAPAADAGTTRQDNAGTGKRAAPEPFAGFSELPESAQLAYRNLLGERDQYKSNYAGLLGKVPTLQRELESLKRQAAPASDTVLAAKLEKFEQYKQRFPEDAEAIDEAISAIRTQLQTATKPLAETLAQVQARLDGYDRERSVGQAAQHVDQLNREHPAWRRIAGWEDEDGNTVPQERQTWHPWFSAWKNSLPPEIQADYDHKLSLPNAVLIGHVLNHFERDARATLAASGQQVSDAPAGVAKRRQEVLADASPRPSRTASEVTPTNPMNGNANGSDRAAILAQFYDSFKSGAKL